MATTKTKKATPKAVKTASKASAQAATKAKAKAPVKPVKTTSKPATKTAAKTPAKTVKTAAKTPVKVAPAKKPVKAPAKAPAKALATKPITKTTAKPAAKATPANAPATSSKAIKAPVKSASQSTPNAANFKPYVAKKGEIYMGKEQLGHFADMLSRLKNELMADIERTVHTMQDEQTVFADPNDRASQETDMALELRNRDRERKLIKKIEETLDRIKADDYGYCDKCGIEIGIKRLEARPTATLCIDCKTLEEMREKQTAK